MSTAKPSKPKGTRDFGPLQMARRSFLLENIKSVFTKFGFLPLETAAMENLSVLTGKYGDEGDQLLFKILNSGDFLRGVDQTTQFDSKQILPLIAEKGLRYDLTVPFARYVVMNRNEINFPFRRYQMQPVWRADRPQKGRYREFLQCDADVIGTDSLLCEAEIIMMLNEIFSLLNLKGFEIAINSRKLLSGMAAYLGQPSKESALCVAIDKIDKIGKTKVFEELSAQGFSKVALTTLEPILEISGSNEDKITALSKQLAGNTAAVAGLRETKEVLDYVKSMSGDLSTINFDPSLARGLSYYTGTIFEVRMLDGSIGSISGGGRYDDLTGVFGMPDISGVGISLGIDRIYDVLEARNLFPVNLGQQVQVMIANFGTENRKFSLNLLAELRANKIRCELYPDEVKLKKQMSYANVGNVPVVIIAGSSEITDDNLTVKIMQTGEQKSFNRKSITNGIISILS